jgi:hypothetical protein
MLAPVFSNRPTAIALIPHDPIRAQFGALVAGASDGALLHEGD